MHAELFDLSGRIALVAGASRGIGEQVALLLARQGAHVIVSSRKADGCQTVVDAIQAAGGSAEALACNVGNMDDIAAAFDHIRSRHGQLDILVNNAATNPYYGPILDTPPDAFQKTLDVNVRGFFYMSVAASKLMRAKNCGAIVNTASVNALQPGNKQGIYSITKAAIVNMTKAFAQECAEYGIRCNALLPVLTRTKFAGGLFDNEEIYARVMQKIPLHRAAEPRDMAATVLLLVADEGSYINGESIVVDGGLTIASTL